MQDSRTKHQPNTKIGIRLKPSKQGTKHHSILTTHFFAKPHLRANGPILPLALRPGLEKTSNINLPHRTTQQRLFITSLISLLVAAFISVVAVVNSQNSASAASITLSIPDSLSLDISGASPSGTFAKSSPATVSTKTDTTTGYTLSIKSKDNVDSNCLKSDSNSSKINSISSTMSEDEFKSSAPMNTWGYQPDKFNSIANSNFLPGPTNTESILDKTTSANPVLGNNYNIVLAAKINTDLPAGSYKNTYTLTATSNALNYSVTYNLNSGTWSGKSPQIGQASGTEFKLDSSVPTKDGFEFVGWCTKETSDTSCSGGVYQAGATYDINCDNNDINMYAMWEKAGPSMQNFSCSSLTLNQTTTLPDKRDGTSYTIAKLKDNNCWMTDNLKIANKTLTSDDSDVASNFSLPASSTSGFDVYDKSFVYVDNTYGYGGYYSWFAATAGEGTQNKSSGDVSHSICPKGWRLPTQTEYSNLVTKLGGTSSTGATALQASPNDFKKGGVYYNGSPHDVGSYGLYWSTSASPSNSDYVYSLGFNDSSVTPDYNRYKGNGQSVRCVARQ